MSEYIRRPDHGNPAKDEIDALPEDIIKKIVTGSYDEAAAAVERLNDHLDTAGGELSEDARRLLNVRRSVYDGRAYD